MKRYFRHLLLAILGKNPFQTELDSLRREYDVLTDKVGKLDDLYGFYKQAIADYNKQVADLQRLVEILRVRVAEKDSLIEQMRINKRA